MEAAGGVAGKHAVPRQHLTDGRGDVFPPQQRHLLYAGHLSWMTTEPGRNVELAGEGRPSTINGSLRR